MKEGMFRQCVEEIGDCLHKTECCCEMQRIDSNTLGRHTPERYEHEGNRVD